jgi:hypothetical protein
MERAVLRLVPIHGESLRTAMVLLIVGGAGIGGAFAGRAYTLDHLPLWSDGRVTALAIVPSDLAILGHRMPALVALPEIKARLDLEPGPFLVYVMPKDYVMQGMIADTGDEWQLYKRHHALAMIWDWIFHPFGHLEGGHFAMHHPGMGGSGEAAGLIRRWRYQGAIRTHPASSPSVADVARSSLPMWKCTRSTSGA